MSLLKQQFLSLFHGKKKRRSFLLFHCFSSTILHFGYPKHVKPFSVNERKDAIFVVLAHESQ